MSNACKLGTHKVWTGPRSLAATEGVSDLIYVPPGTKMFQFPGLPRHTYVFSVPHHDVAIMVGFPIRKSSDHSLVGGSPKHIAASHVLHRQ